MITSTSNGKIKELINLKKSKKAREEKGIFLVEGWRVFEEIPPHLLEATFVTEKFYEKEKERLEARLQEKGGKLELVSEEVFSYVADTKTPQGILSISRKPVYQFEDLLKGRPHLLFLEELQDPGNLGTIVRGAEAAGATGLICSKGCVDLFNPKVTRSTMGSLFRLPHLVVESLEEAIKQCKEAGVKVFAAHLEGTSIYYQEDYCGSIGFLIGNEGAGLSPRISNLADQKILIPMEGQVESLNAGVASGILMFEAKRQRDLH